MPDPRCLRCARRVPWVSLTGNSSLAFYKMLLGVLGGSSALFVDGTHSLADVVGSIGIVITSRVAARPPDAHHPYGHGKAEFVGAVVVYTILLAFSGAILIGATLVVARGRTEKPHIVTLLGAVVSVLVNYVMYLFGQCAGTRCNSPALLADAFENRADSLSSTAAVLGIGAALLIHPVFDPIAAMAVGLIILWNSVTQLRHSLANLIDRALPVEVAEAIRRLALDHAEVRSVAFVKTRRTGRRYWVDVGVRVPGRMPVTRSDEIATALRADLMQRCEEFEHVEVFVMPWEPSSAAAAGAPSAGPSASMACQGTS